MPRLEAIQSTSANSLSLVFAQFAFGTNLKETLAEIESQVRQLDLPEGGEPQVSAFNINDQPVIIATVSPLEGADQVEAAPDRARRSSCPRSGASRASRPPT